MASDTVENISIGRPTWAEVDLGRLRSNYQLLRKHLPRQVKILAVVKANAYGHGAVEVVRTLEACGIDQLAVALLEEGLELRQAGIERPILLLNGFWPGQEEAVVRNHLVPVVFNLEMIHGLAKAARRCRRRAAYHFKIDTGMCRLGFDFRAAAAQLAEATEIRDVQCQGLLTHFIQSELPKDRLARLQIQRFLAVVDQVKKRIAPVPLVHMANSAGILNYPGSWQDGVRPGLMLYGINPLESPCPLDIQPLLSWKTRIMHINQARKGTGVGYGATFQTARPSRIATLPVGYADGVNRLLSNLGAVLVQGQRVPIVGRISMDLMTVDVTGIPAAQVGDEVVLLGHQGGQEITAREMAGRVGSIPYEILCRIGARVPRVYLDGA